ncbi:penicillin acylase family protein [Rhodohalobacter barkolensis]|uniref:Penicillin acylase family protein n=2 Tax=Rhodohalobacter barkolensis TaxID=2053187 RepID=A0A2N0VKW6_9BACT|nr:penicillin acylase family protein [Rhodohalobacter barkolensis]
MYFERNFQSIPAKLSNSLQTTMRTFLKILLLLLFLIAGFAIIGTYWTFYKPLPDYSATLSLNGLNNPVDVHWDPYGVPYIYAESEEDLYYTAGYIHAQERLWQMTLQQLAAEGRFAEFLGEDLVELDKYQRALGFWETAQRIEDEASPEMVRLIQKYTDGVNDYARENARDLPIEFTLLDMEPIEWTSTHTFAVTRLMAWDQNIYWWSELAYASLEEKLEPNRLQELFPEYSDLYPTTLDDNQSRTIASSIMPVLSIEQKRRSLLSMEGSQWGSNAWAVSGEKSEGEMPILAGDPHMGLSIPGFWFEMHYNTPNQSITGASIPGAPFIILGNNDHMAWSITNMMADVLDFFVEQPDQDNPGRYIVDSNSENPETEPFRYRNELIKVKDGDDVLFRVRHTQNGPVISDLYDSDELLGDQLVSVAWTGHEVSQEGEAVYDMNRATNIDQFEEAVQKFKSPAMNFTYADRDGNIALFSAGNIPIRDYNPLLFRRGDDPSYRWNGQIPFNELPQLKNPPSGFVAHANNKLHTDSYRHYIGSFWAPPSRISRISRFLEGADSLSVLDMQQLQFDAFSDHAREITEEILPILRSDSENDFSTVLTYLENWDYNYHPNSTAASIFDLFFLNVSQNTLTDDIGEEAYEALISLNYLPIQIMSRLLTYDSRFFDDIQTEETESREDLVRQSMLETISQLEEEFGDEAINWRWENVNQISLKPPLFTEAAEAPDAPGILRVIVSNLMSKGPYPVRGNAMTVNKAQYSWDNPFQVNLGPSIRRIIDFSSPGRSLSVLPTGQSGNPLSTHYGDQTDMWLEGRYRYIYRDSTFFQQTSYQTMHLLPLR